MTYREVYEYSADLANVVGIQGDKGVEATAKAISNVFGWKPPIPASDPSGIIRPGEAAHLGSLDQLGRPLSYVVVEKSYSIGPGKR